MNTPVGSRDQNCKLAPDGCVVRSNPSAVVANSCTHRRRDATKQFRRVGGVCWALGLPQCFEICYVVNLPFLSLLFWALTPVMLFSLSSKIIELRSLYNLSLLSWTHVQPAAPRSILVSWLVVGELTAGSPCTPSVIKPHAYFIVPQDLNCRKNHVNRKKIGIHSAYQPFVYGDPHSPQLKNFGGRAN